MNSKNNQKYLFAVESNYFCQRKGWSAHWSVFFKKTPSLTNHEEALVLRKYHPYVPLVLLSHYFLTMKIWSIPLFSMAWKSPFISKRNCSTKHRHFYRFFALLQNFFNNCLSKHQVDLLGLQRELQNFSGTPLSSVLIDPPVCLSLTAGTHLEGFSFWTAAETLFYLILILTCQNPSPCCLECSGTSAWCEAVVCLRAKPAAHLSWLGRFQGRCALDLAEVFGRVKEQTAWMKQLDLQHTCTKTLMYTWTQPFHHLKLR